ncbi:hypothetical protein D779_0664 [Imhoffiella purpurea]|uniref:Uncharacterized protein n=1 Tax=Imhoffiella purpurea TaxID=1249627 RepID=W9W078_9GAMM|nr:hypothetical protein D779_0664 [Imhoffiella purpurea]
MGSPEIGRSQCNRFQTMMVRIACVEDEALSGLAWHWGAARLEIAIGEPWMARARRVREPIP